MVSFIVFYELLKKMSLDFVNTYVSRFDGVIRYQRASLLSVIFSCAHYRSPNIETL